MLLALISVLLNACAQITIKKAVDGSIENWVDLFKNPYTYITGVFYLLSIIFWFGALARLQLSVAYPLQALGYVVVSLAAILVFQERLNLMNWLGLGLIILGVFLTQAHK